MPKVSRKTGRDALAGREIELKFLVDPKALGLLESVPLIGRSLARQSPANS